MDILNNRDLSSHTLGTFAGEYDVIGQIFPNTFCSYLDTGEDSLSIVNYNPGLRVAGIVARKSENDCSAYVTGDKAVVVKEGMVNLQYIENSGRVAKTGFIVSNTDEYNGLVWNMVNIWTSIPGFLVGLPVDLNLDASYGFHFHGWSDKTNWVAAVILRGVDPI